MSRNLTTWRKELRSALEKNDETFDHIVECTLTNKQLDEEFDKDYGLEEGVPFTCWTFRRVYFPACYDGKEWVESVPRNPCGEATRHIGG